MIRQRYAFTALMLLVGCREGGAPAAAPATTAAAGPVTPAKLDQKIEVPLGHALAACVSAEWRSRGLLQDAVSRARGSGTVYSPSHWAVRYAPKERRIQLDYFADGDAQLGRRVLEKAKGEYESTASSCAASLALALSPAALEATLVMRHFQLSGEREKEVVRWENGVYSLP